MDRRRAPDLRSPCRDHRGAWREWLWLVGPLFADCMQRRRSRRDPWRPPTSPPPARRHLTGGGARSAQGVAAIARPIRATTRGSPAAVRRAAPLRVALRVHGSAPRMAPPMSSTPRGRNEATRRRNVNDGRTTETDSSWHSAARTDCRGFQLIPASDLQSLPSRTILSKSR